MKTDDIIILGIGAAAIVYFVNASKGIGIATTGLGSSVAETAGAVSGVASTTGNELSRTLRNVSGAINQPISAIQTIEKNIGSLPSTITTNLQTAYSSLIQRFNTAKTPTTTQSKTNTVASINYAKAVYTGTSAQQAATNLYTGKYNSPLPSASAVKSSSLAKSILKK